MTTSLLINGADTYLKSEWQLNGTSGRKRTALPFITISRQAGSGGANLGRILTRKLNGRADEATVWTVYERNLITRMLKDNHLPVRLARYVPEDHVPEINAWLGEMVGLHPSLMQLAEKTYDTTREIASAGHAILIGRGSNFATADLPNGLHIRLVAPVQARAAYLAKLYNISLAEATELNAKCDVARQRYVRTHFSANVDDPSAYDLVINTAKVSLLEAAEMIVTQIQNHNAAPV